MGALLRALVVSALALVLTYGVWLLVTADEGDGGREAVGGLVVGFVAFVVVVFGIRACVGATSSRRGGRRRRPGPAR
jgi:hypothetical protein